MSKIVNIEGDENEGSLIIYLENNEKIEVEFDMMRQCCESINCEISEDFEKNIGGKLLKYDMMLIGQDIDDEDEDYDAKVEINTSEGDIIMKVRNNHNGYYSHSLSIFDSRKDRIVYELSI